MDPIEDLLTRALLVENPHVPADIVPPQEPEDSED